MLCCWLQQLQEFGGPEVEKPDLLKGSIGSLKNLGLPPPPKTGSGSDTLVRHNTTVAGALELKARYNVSVPSRENVLLEQSFLNVPFSVTYRLKWFVLGTICLSTGYPLWNRSPLCKRFVKKLF